MGNGALQAPAGEFNFTRLERVIFGPGTVASLGAEMERRGLRRAVAVTGKTLGGSQLLDRVRKALGERCVAVFTGAVQHVPAGTVRQLVAELASSRADTVISFGGGSPIDTAKVALASLLGTSRDTLVAQGVGVAAAQGAGQELTHIAIPTTLSAGEYTPLGGVTEETARVKHGVMDPRLQPRLVVNDPELTLETPDWLWAATGMRALDHAVEAAYSRRHQMLTDTLAAKAIALLREHLPISLERRGAESIAHRGHCQLASWFSIFGAMNTRFGISHALGHQIGPRWNVPHGVTSCITLPHVMRFMAGIAPERFGPIAEGMGVRFDLAAARKAALECADRVGDFIGHFGLPHTLSQAGVKREELPEIADTVLAEVEHSKVVDRPVTRKEIIALLEAAY